MQKPFKNNFYTLKCNKQEKNPPPPQIGINFVDCAAAIECTGVVSLAQVS